MARPHDRSTAQGPSNKPGDFNKESYSFLPEGQDSKWLSSSPVVNYPFSFKELFVSLLETIQKEMIEVLLLAIQMKVLKYLLYITLLPQNR